MSSFFPGILEVHIRNLGEVPGPEIATSRIITKKMIMEAMGPEEAALARRERQNQHTPYKNTRAVKGIKE